MEALGLGVEQQWLLAGVLIADLDDLVAETLSLSHLSVGFGILPTRGVDSSVCPACDRFENSRSRPDPESLVFVPYCVSLTVLLPSGASCRCRDNDHRLGTRVMCWSVKETMSGLWVVMMTMEP